MMEYAEMSGSRLLERAISDLVGHGKYMSTAIMTELDRRFPRVEERTAEDVKATTAVLASTAVGVAEARIVKANIEELERQVEAWKSAASYIVTGPEHKHMRATTPQELIDASKRLNDRLRLAEDVARSSSNLPTPSARASLAEQRVTSAGQAILDIGARLGAKPVDGQNVLHFADVLMEMITAQKTNLQEARARIQLLENAKAIQSLRRVANLVGVVLVPGTDWGLKITRKYASTQRLYQQATETAEALAKERDNLRATLRNAHADADTRIAALESLNKAQHGTLEAIDQALGEVLRPGDAFSSAEKYVAAIKKLQQVGADDPLHREISAIVHARAGSAELAMSAANHVQSSNPATADMFRKIARAYMNDLERKLGRKE